MPIRIGSNEYFKSNQAARENVNKIGSEKLKGFEKFCTKVAKFIRKYLICGIDKQDWKTRVTTRVDSLSEKVLKKQIGYNTAINNHVNGMIEDVQQNAFTEFMKGIPTIRAKVSELKGMDQLSQHPELLKSLNAIDGDKKLEACTALSSLLATLAGVSPVVGSEADPFYAKVKELESELGKKGSEENKFVAANLKNLTQALSIWPDPAIQFKPADDATENQKNKGTVVFNEAVQKEVLRKWGLSSKSIEGLLTVDALNKAKTIPLAKIWAEKMKNQRIDLIILLPEISNKYEFKRYGFFQDRVDEANKIAKMQKKDLKKLDVSFANFLADQTTDLWEPLAIGLKKAKSETITKNEKNLKDAEEGLSKYTDIGDLAILRSNIAIYEKNKQIFQKHWNLDGLDKKIGKEQARIGKLTKKINKDYSDKRIAKLSSLYAESADKRKEINVKLVTYSVKHSFATLCFGVKSLELAEDANAAECGQIIDEADEAIRAFSIFLNELKYLKQEGHDNFQFDAWKSIDSDEIETYSFEDIRMWTEGLLKDYRTAKNRAIDRAQLIEDLALLETGAEAVGQANAAAEDQLFLDNLLFSYDLEQTNDDGNCFFHSIKAGLEHLDGFDAYKAMTAEELRVAMYAHMKVHAGDYQFEIAQFLSTDVLDYAQAPDDRADALILQKAPNLQNLYTDFRAQYNAQNSNKSDLSDNLMAGYLNDATVIAYADAMEAETTYVDLREALVMADMLNIRLDIRSKALPNDGVVFKEDLVDLPVIHIHRPKSKPHFELLVEKKIAPDAGTTAT